MGERSGGFDQAGSAWDTEAGPMTRTTSDCQWARRPGPEGPRRRQLGTDRGRGQRTSQLRTVDSDSGRPQEKGSQTRRNRRSGDWCSRAGDSDSRRLRAILGQEQKGGPRRATGRRAWPGADAAGGPDKGLRKGGSPRTGRVARPPVGPRAGRVPAGPETAKARQVGADRRAGKHWGCIVYFEPARQRGGYAARTQEQIRGLSPPSFTRGEAPGRRDAASDGGVEEQTNDRRCARSTPNSGCPSDLKSGRIKPCKTVFQQEGKK